MSNKLLVAALRRGRCPRSPSRMMPRHADGRRRARPRSKSTRCGSNRRPDDSRRDDGDLGQRRQVAAHGHRQGPGVPLGGARYQGPLFLHLRDAGRVHLFLHAAPDDGRQDRRQAGRLASSDAARRPGTAGRRAPGAARRWCVGRLSGRPRSERTAR